MRDKSKVIGKKVVTLKGIKIEVRLLEISHHRYWQLDKSKKSNRILPKCRFYPPTILSHQEEIRKKLKGGKKRK